MQKKSICTKYVIVKELQEKSESQKTGMESENTTGYKQKKEEPDENQGFFSGEQRLNPKKFTLFRLDGHGFSRFVKKFEMQKPFDDRFTEAMINTAMEGLTYMNFLCGFVGSDEITYCMRPLTEENIKSGGTLEFNGRVEKINSLLAGKVSTTFFIELTKACGFEKTKNFDPHFDCRAFQVDTLEQVLANISERVTFTLKNSRMMLAQHHFSQKKLNNVSSKKAVEMLLEEKGIDFEATVKADNRVGNFLFFKKLKQKKEVEIKNQLKQIEFQRRTPQNCNFGPKEILELTQKDLD